MHFQPSRYGQHCRAVSSHRYFVSRFSLYFFANRPGLRATETHYFCFYHYHYHTPIESGNYREYETWIFGLNPINSTVGAARPLRSGQRFLSLSLLFYFSFSNVPFLRLTRFAASENTVLRSSRVR